MEEEKKVMQPKPDARRSSGRHLYFFGARDRKWGFLSNFYESEQRMLVGKKMLVFRTNEHWYQYCKCVLDEEAERIRNAKSPNVARKLGRVVELRPNWDGIKLYVMYKGLQAKFTQNVELAKWLIGTYPMRLHEDAPNDYFWGVKGQDRLGFMLEVLRSSLLSKGVIE